AAYGTTPNVIVVSDHGFEANTTHPMWRGWDSAGGIAIAAGPSFPHRDAPLAVSYYDLVPTVMDVVGLAAPDGMRGSSLLRRWSACSDDVVLHVHAYVARRDVYGVAHLEPELRVPVARDVDVQHDAEVGCEHARTDHRSRGTDVHDLPFEARAPVALRQQLELVRADERRRRPRLVVRVRRVVDLEAPDLHAAADDVPVEDVHVAE